VRKTSILLGSLLLAVNCTDDSLGSAIGEIELALCDRLPACECEVLTPETARIDFGSPEYDPIAASGSIARRSLLIHNTNQPRKLTITRIEIVDPANGFGVTGVQWRESEEDDADVDIEGRVEQLRRRRQDTARQLEALAKQAASEPAFASDKETPRQELPGGVGWIVPRPLNAEHVRHYNELSGGRPSIFTDPETDEVERIEANVQQAEGYLYLCGHGIEEYEIAHADDEVEHGSYAANRSKRNTERVCALLSPALSDWLELWLQYFNGITMEQRSARDLP